MTTENEERHAGLNVLINLDLRVAVNTLGEQGAIDLIAALVSGKARTTDAALDIVAKSGLL